MLKNIADGILVHASEFIQSNTVVVEGRDGVLLIDPGITAAEMVAIADDLRARDARVVAGFSTHPDWDHVLWHERFGDVPRYGTARGAAYLSDLLVQPDWETQVAEGLPPEYADQIPMELLGRISGLAENTSEVPWEGPRIRVIEHRAHAPGHAALFVEESGVLVAGDMLSDILMPFIDLDAQDPIGDYLEALRLFEGIADAVGTVVPGHGSVGGNAEMRTRLEQDRAYLQALRDGDDPDDVRTGPLAPLDWLPDVHRWQRERFNDRQNGHTTGT